MIFLISAGGTGGHIMPALAVSRALQARDTWEINWIGTRGMESSLLSRESVDFFPIDIVALRGKGWGRMALYPFILFRACIQTLIILIRIRPAGVLVTGGYVGFPTAVAAMLLGTPFFIQEQNTRWGWASRLMGRLARKIYVGFPQNKRKNKRIVCYGNPTPMEMCVKRNSSPFTRYEKRRGPLRIFITGGSQGALVFNRTVPRSLRKLAPQNFVVRHQCGAGWLTETRKNYTYLKSEVRVEEFIDDMLESYLWADLVIARAGAMTLAEISLVGVAAWLVPFPFAADNHQELNALFFASKGAARVINQRNFTVSALAENLGILVKESHKKARQLLGDRATQAYLLATPRASREIAADITQELQCA